MRALTIGLIAQAWLLAMIYAQSSETPKPASSEKGSFTAAVEKVLSDGTPTQMHGESIKLLGLLDTTGHWPCKSIEKIKKGDQSHHQISVGGDVNKYVVLNFRTAGDKTSTSWRTNADGQLLLTVYSEDAVANIVPNSKYAAEFDQEKAIWARLLGQPDAPATASPAKTSTP